MEKLKIYTVSDDYIEYIKKYDKNILFGRGEGYATSRKYVGVVLSMNDFQYFAPLSSPKDSDYFYKHGERLIRRSIIPIVRLIKGKNNLLGKIRLSNMIPVPSNCLTLYDIDNEPDIKYKSLLRDEIICIRKNRDTILKNAKILYNQKVKQYSGINYLSSTVDFCTIENYCKQYKPSLDNIIKAAETRRNEKRMQTVLTHDKDKFRE